MANEHHGIAAYTRVVKADGTESIFSRCVADEFERGVLRISAIDNGYVMREYPRGWWRTSASYNASGQLLYDFEAPEETRSPDELLAADVHYLPCGHSLLLASLQANRWHYRTCQHPYCLRYKEVRRDADGDQDARQDAGGGDVAADGRDVHPAARHE